MPSKKVAVATAPDMTRSATEQMAYLQTLARAEWLLEEVKAGNIVAFTVAFIKPDKPYTGSTSGIGAEDVHSAKLMHAAIAELAHEWQHVVRGK